MKLGSRLVIEILIEITYRIGIDGRYNLGSKLDRTFDRG